MKLIDACDKVLHEDPRTRDNKYLWTYFVKVLNELGISIYIKFQPGMPSPESIIKERRDLLNKPDPKTGKLRYKRKFEPEENTPYTPKE